MRGEYGGEYEVQDFSGAEGTLPEEAFEGAEAETFEEEGEELPDSVNSGFVLV